MGQEAPASSTTGAADIAIPKPPARPADVIGSSGIAMPAGATIDQDSGAINVPVVPPAEDPAAMAPAEQPQPNPDAKPGERPDKSADPEKAKDDKESPKEPDPVSKDDQLREAAEKVGVDYNALTEEFAKTGTVSEEAIQKAEEAMAKNGIQGGADIIRDIMAARQAAQASVNAEFVKMAGSADKWNAAITWAQGNDAPVDVKAVVQNAMRAGTSVSATLEAAKFVVDRFQQSGPVEGSRVESTAVPAADPDLFHSQDEMALAMADPRYRKDPAYRRAVESRIHRSMVAGTFKW